jgi:protein-L-isoaspartate(D-aspartate) O-methyltransferase
MFDTATARRMMVDGQVRTADVTNLDLIAAMLAVPRELFVPQAVAGQAYLDSDITVGKGRALLKPMVLAKLIQAAQVSGADHVLDVGCATGYSSAVLSRVVGSVVALEEDATLAREAQAVLAAVGAASVVVATGPLTAGWPAAPPYDLILLNGSTEVAPEALGRQLKPNGRIVGVFGPGSNGKGIIYRMVEGHLVGRPIFDASAPLLPGFAATPAFVF